MSLPELPPLPREAAGYMRGSHADLQDGDKLFIEDQISAYAQAYGLLCLRQGWRMGAEKCAETIAILGSINCTGAYNTCMKVASDSPK